MNWYLIVGLWCLAFAAGAVVGWLARPASDQVDAYWRGRDDEAGLR